jgi:hypothetical protein
MILQEAAGYQTLIEKLELSVFITTLPGAAFARAISS